MILLLQLCNLQPHVGNVCLFLIWLTVFCFFPDVVDSRFTEQVDSLPDIVDNVPGFVDIFLKVLTLCLALCTTLEKVECFLL